MAQVYTMCALHVTTYQRKHATSHPPLFLLNYDSLNLIALWRTSQAYLLAVAIPSRNENIPQVILGRGSYRFVVILGCRRYCFVVILGRCSYHFVVLSLRSPITS